MTNPFKLGTLVDDEFFTDRVSELESIQRMLDSENHLVLISPRRFGKSSLVAKAVKASGRPSISLNLQNMLSIEDCIKNPAWAFPSVSIRAYQAFNDAFQDCPNNIYQSHY